MAERWVERLPPANSPRNHRQCCGSRQPSSRYRAPVRLLPTCVVRRRESSSKRPRVCPSAAKSWLPKFRSVVVKVSLHHSLASVILSPAAESAVAYAEVAAGVHLQAGSQAASIPIWPKRSVERARSGRSVLRATRPATSFGRLCYARFQVAATHCGCQAATARHLHLRRWQY